eukprot:TRINITY_DN208_c0_g1_i1.p1 TRINITY_DN208_c0_g1~~TRINITY_DN208_c0_g1_i1.p1  ORF type:complete len:854 (-),score=256.52 TRINITY_DN208_c0_g1_i1:31-2592(-)
MHGQKRRLRSFRVETQFELSYTSGRVIVSPDGKHLVCIGGENVNLLEKETGKAKLRIPGDGEAFTSLAVRPNDGKKIVVASRSSSVYVWSIETGEEGSGGELSSHQERSWRPHMPLPVVSMNYDPSGALLATGSTDGTVRVWDMERSYLTHDLHGHHDGVVSLVQFHPIPQTLVLFSCGFEDNTVCMWDLVTKTITYKVTGHGAHITSISFFPSDPFVMCCGSRDRTVTVHDLRKKEKSRTIVVFEEVEAMCFENQGSAGPENEDEMEVEIDEEEKEMRYHLCVSGPKGRVLRYNVLNGECLNEGEDHHTVCPDPIVQLEEMGCKQMLVVTEERNILFMKDGNVEKVFVGFNDEILGIAGLGCEELAIATNSPILKILHPKSGSWKLLPGHRDTIMNVTYCNPFGVLATCSKDGSILLWKRDEFNHWTSPFARIEGHSMAVTSIAFSAGDTKDPFLVSGSVDGTIKLWSLRFILSEKMTRKATRSVDDGLIQIQSKCSILAHEKDVNCVAVAPNNTMVATCSSDRSIILWNIQKEVTGEIFFEKGGVLLGHRRGVWSVAFSPVDRALLSTGADQTVRLWRLSDFSCIRTMEGHLQSVLSGKFFVDGKEVVTCGSDGLVKVWDLSSGDCIGTCDEHEGKIWAIDLFDGGMRLATGDAESRINIWVDCTDEVIETAFQEDEEKVLREQEFENCLRTGKFGQGMLQALRLGNYGALFRVVDRWIADVHTRTKSDHDAIELFVKEISDIVGALDDSKLMVVFTQLCEWNTASKRSHVAQFLLHALLRLISIDRMVEIKGMEEILEPLLAYSFRHYDRIDKLVETTYFVPYTIRSMGRLPGLSSPEVNDEITGQLTNE